MLESEAFDDEPALVCEETLLYEFPRRPQLDRGGGKGMEPYERKGPYMSSVFSRGWSATFPSAVGGHCFSCIRTEGVPVPRLPETVLLVEVPAASGGWGKTHGWWRGLKLTGADGIEYSRSSWRPFWTPYKTPLRGRPNG
jgi:hypothetical protein